MPKYHKNLKKSLKRMFADDRGAAMVIVLSIIFMMTTLGAIALLATMGNLKMSIKYSQWNSEYYALDAEAENRLRYIDTILSKAENYSLAYMRDELYRVFDGAPQVTGDDLTDINDKAQAFISNSWQNNVYLPSLKADRPGGVELVDESRYSSLFTHFNDEFFKRLYYYFSYRMITREVKEGRVDDITLSPAMIGFAGMLEEYAHDPDGMKVCIDISDGKEEYAKHLTVNINITAPIYGLDTQTEDVPFRANPIWSSALTARGAIVFSGGADATSAVTRIYGDVNAQDYDKNYLNLSDYTVREGDEFGILSAGASVEIYGNVYTRGDLHVTKDGGNITVRRYPEGFRTRYKRGLYKNSLFFNTSVVPVMIQKYTQPEDEGWGRDYIPYFYRDNFGGNVYCNNVLIGDVAGASIVIDNGPALLGGVMMPGVVWTYDDVHNDGHFSSIKIAGNLIGISSDALFNDHTSSSAVINSRYKDSVIELLGAIVMPGTSFLKFDEVNDLADDETYFQTAESVSAENPSIFRTYMEKPSFVPDTLYYYDRYTLFTDRGASDFFLVHYEAPIDKMRHLISGLEGRIPDTGIVTGENLEGYALGAIISKDLNGNKRMFGAPGFGDIAGYREIKNYSQNYLAYSEIRDSLKAVFSIKTESLGTAGYKFGDLVNRSAVVDPAGQLYPGIEGVFTYFKGDAVLELDDVKSGIVYCAAQDDDTVPMLTIRGNGEFRGTIICEGKILIEGDPTISFDEDLIAKIVLFYPEVKNFFSPGEMGDTSYVRVMRLSQGMTKLKKDRYKLTGWTQWQE